MILIVLLLTVLSSVPSGGGNIANHENGIVARSDTVRAGEVFIVLLPDSLHGHSVQSYGGTRLPVKSYLLERSFFWRTDRLDAGSHTIWFRAYLAENTVDSLAVQVVVRK